MSNLLKTFATDVTTPHTGETGNIGSENLGGNIITIINWIVGILGIVAVGVIILGGVQYMTSTGDAGKVKKAKDTIMYGVIGLVIVGLSFAIVNFVIANLIQGKQ